MRRQFLFGCLFIALAAVIFSTMEVLLKLPAVAGAFHPMQITLERFLVGGICLLPVAGWTLRRKGIRLTRRDVGTFALTGLFCVPLSMVLYQLAITHGQANVVAVLFSGNPIFVTLLAFLLLHETIAWNNLLALVLEVLGIGAIAGLGGSAVSLSSVALAVLAALLHVSRDDASALVRSERVLVNHVAKTAPAAQLGEGDLLTVRGLGRFKLKEVGGQTKKGRIFVTCIKY